ncbi:MAG TPA: DNA polymerase III subunit delta' [Bacteroidales bacterium]|nr:DNA polymerase III subunit delta' [Bacteroidales bacterium]
MNFAQIPGQTDTIARLLRSVKEERVSHAQLFTGPEGCGSLALALAYAQYVSCENKEPGDSCGTCKSCVKYEKLVHPDLHFVFPVIKKKSSEEAVSDNYIEEWREFVRKSPFFTLNNWLDTIEVGNAQGMIFASEASEIIRKLSLKTFESDYKIMIIWLPERMHQAAANKVLKMIEEPPEKTLFILVSEEPDKLLPTIVSRCQLVKIPSFANDEIKSYLRSKYGLTEIKATDIARVANGNILRAAELTENDESSKQNLENFKLIMRFAWKRDVISVIGWSEEMASLGREGQKNFLAYSLRLLRENLMLTLEQLQNRLVFLAGEEAEFSAKFHPFITRENIYALTEEFSLAYSHIEANGYAKVIFLDLGLKITRLIR